jgi:hypothetical protein
MTQRMLADLGRLTLRFAALEEHLSWAYNILHPAGPQAARAKRPPEGFQCRLSNVRDFVQSRAKGTSLESHPKVTEFLDLLNELKAVAYDRNMYIHGKLTELPEVNMRFVSHQPPGGETRHREITSETLPALNQRIREASVSFVRLTLDLYKISKDSEAEQKRSARKQSPPSD